MWIQLLIHEALCLCIGLAYHSDIDIIGRTNTCQIADRYSDLSFKTSQDKTIKGFILRWVSETKSMNCVGTYIRSQWSMLGNKIALGVFVSRILNGGANHPFSVTRSKWLYGNLQKWNCDFGRLKCLWHHTTIWGFNHQNLNNTNLFPTNLCILCSMKYQHNYSLWIPTLQQTS